MQKIVLLYIVSLHDKSTVKITAKYLHDIPVMCIRYSYDISLLKSLYIVLKCFIIMSYVHHSSYILNFRCVCVDMNYKNELVKIIIIDNWHFITSLSNCSTKPTSLKGAV